MSDLIERAKAILTYPKVGEDTKAVIRDLMTALTAALARPARVYDAALGTITAQDRENAGDLLVDMQEIVSPQDCILPDELAGVVAEWFRKVRYEAVMADRLARPAEGDGWKPILRELADAAEYDLTMNQGDDCEGWWTLRTLLAIRAARKLLATRPAQAEDGELRQAVLHYLSEHDNPCPDYMHRHTLRERMRELAGGFAAACIKSPAEESR